VNDLSKREDLSEGDTIIARAALGACRMFGFLDEAQKDRLLTLAEVRRVTKGELLVRPGDAASHLWIVASGLVRVFKTAPNGKEHNLHLCGPGMTFAEVAVIDDFPVPAFAAAVDPATLVGLDAIGFRALLRADHDLCLQLLPGLGAWVRSLVGLLEDIVLRDAHARLARWLLDRSGAHAEVDMPMARRHLASHLNLTPETLSRTLRRLEDDGLISQNGDRITVRAMDRLHQVAQGVFPTI
jgi:CRP-like cAMP-binding protein